MPTSTTSLMQCKCIVRPTSIQSFMLTHLLSRPPPPLSLSLSLPPSLSDSSTLYKDSVFIGCSLYLLCQLVLLCRSSLCSLLYLTAAGTVGGASFLLFSQFSCFLCTALGAWSVEVAIIQIESA